MILSGIAMSDIGNIHGSLVDIAMRNDLPGNTDTKYPILPMSCQCKSNSIQM